MIVDDHQLRGREYHVGFDHDDLGAKVVDRPPDVVVVAVDIDHQKVEVFRNAAIFEQNLDVARPNPCVHRGGVRKSFVVVGKFLRASPVALNLEACPAVVQHQVAHIAVLDPVVSAKLNGKLGTRFDDFEDLLDNTVLAEL